MILDYIIAFSRPYANHHSCVHCTSLLTPQATAGFLSNGNCEVRMNQTLPGVKHAPLGVARTLDPRSSAASKTIKGNSYYDRFRR